MRYEDNWSPTDVGQYRRDPGPQGPPPGPAQRYGWYPPQSGGPPPGPPAGAQSRPAPGGGYGSSAGGGGTGGPIGGAPPTGVPTGVPGGRPPGTRARLRPVTVETLVETDVATVEPNASIGYVVSQMAERDVGSVVVVEDGSPRGIVTDRQLALSVERFPDVGNRTVDELLAAGAVTGADALVTGSTDMTVSDAVRILEENGIRRLPVVDEDGTLAGVLALDDVLDFLATELDDAVEVIRRQALRP